jgi:hypothetical protein
MKELLARLALGILFRGRTRHAVISISALDWLAEEYVRRNPHRAVSAAWPELREWIGAASHNFRRSTRGRP